MDFNRIGRYEIQRRLGTGGMGSLYLAHDPSLHRLVAIKLLRDDFNDDLELRERFTREARSVARLSHPNIVIVHDVGEHEGRPFMAMEYIAGETLTHVLRRKPPMPLGDRLGLMEALCAGLAHAHSVGIVHRDIKPANVMLDAGGVLKILDFGIARLTNSGMTQDGMMLGSVNYMSPEQVVGRGVDHRTDIFATGAVLYEAIALVQAFPGGIDTGVLHRILNTGPEPLQTRVPDIDLELAGIVHRALEREPGQRYQDINAMRRDLIRVRRRLIEEVPESTLGVPPDHTAIARPRTSRSGTGRPVDSDRPRRLDPARFAELRRQQLEEHLRLGEDAFSKGDHEAALHHAERAAAVDPDSRAAYDLIDKARFEIDQKAVRQLLGDASQMLSEGRLDEASALMEQAQGSVPDLTQAGPLRDEVHRVAGEIAALREREHRIASSLERARTSIERGGYETALRAVYEALALDPDRAEARELEQLAQSRLQAKREHEQARRTAHDRLKVARKLTLEKQFDEAARVIEQLVPPSDTVRLAAAEALESIRTLQRQAAHAATIAQAQADFAERRFERALAAIDTIPEADRTDEARSLQQAAAHALRQERELQEKRRALEGALTAVEALIKTGDLAKALERLEDGARIGLDDPRIGSLRQRIADLAVAAQEKRRQEARDRLAERTVEAARRLFAKGEQAAAIESLQRDRSGHALIETALRELRTAVAEQEERARQEAERKRLEEEARRAAEIEAARRREQQLKAEEQRRKEEERRLQEAAQQRRREQIAALVSTAEQALKAGRVGEASDALGRAAAVGPVEGGAELIQRLAAAKAEVERRERRRRDLERHLELAHERLAQGKLDGAREATDAALALDSEHPVALKVRAEIEQEIQRQAAEAKRLEEARRREEEARRRAEEERRRAEEVAALLKNARKVREDEAALDLLNQALTLVPGDARVEALVRERHAALERRRADEQRRQQLTAATTAVEAALTRNELDEAERLIADGVRQFDARSFESLRKELSARRRAEAREREAAEQAAQRERERLERERQRLEREERARREREEDELRRAKAREREAAEQAAQRERERLEQERQRLEREERARREREEEEELRRAAESGATLLASRPAAVEAPSIDVAQPTITRSPAPPAARRAPVRQLVIAASVLVAVVVGTLVFRSIVRDDVEVPAEPVSRSAGDAGKGAGAIETAKPESERPPAPPPGDISTPPDETPKVDATAAMEQKIQAHRARARNLLTRGQTAQALTEVQSALRLRSDDRETREILNAIARDATATLQRAKEDATAKGAAAAAAQTYRTAATLEADAERERRAGRLDRAVPLWWNARDRFVAAATEAANRPTAAPQPTPAPEQQPDLPKPAPPVTTPVDRPASPEPSPPQAPSSDAAADRAAIEQLLRDYVAAYNRMDEGRLQQIDPTFRGIPSRPLLKSVELKLSGVSITFAPDGQSATVRATQNFTYEANRARFPPTGTGTLTWTLRKAGTTWRVVP